MCVIVVLKWLSKTKRYRLVKVIGGQSPAQKYYPGYFGGWSAAINATKELNPGRAIKSIERDPVF